MQTETNPYISIVINTILGGSYLRRCINAVLTQRQPPPFEVIVPVVPFLDDVRALCAEFPSVRFVEIEKLPVEIDVSNPALAHVMYDRRRTAGLAAARGEIVALTEDQMVPDPDWCATVAKAHEESHGAIGGAVENAGDSALHLALYLCDFGSYQTPFSEGEALYLTDQNVSYKRHALERVRHVWSDFYHEPAVHEALRDAGETLWLSPKCIVRFDRGKLQLAEQLRERFSWGRVFGGKRAQRVSATHRIGLLVFAPLIPAVILTRRIATAHRRGLPLSRIVTAAPGMLAMVLFWVCGEFTGYLTARPLSGSAINY